jgi:hypothetical protein
VGKVECDASIMDGATNHYGAVGALPGKTIPHLILGAECQTWTDFLLELIKVTL